MSRPTGYLRRRRHGAARVSASRSKWDRAGPAASRGSVRDGLSQPQAHQVRNSADKADDPLMRHRDAFTSTALHCAQQPALQRLHADPKIVPSSPKRSRLRRDAIHHTASAADNQGRGPLSKRRPFGLAQTAHSPQRQLAQLGVIAQPDRTPTSALHKALMAIPPAAGGAAQRTLLRPTEDEKSPPSPPLPINAASIGIYRAISPSVENGSTSQLATASAPLLMPSRPGSARVAKQPRHHAAGERASAALHRWWGQHPRQTDGQPDMARYVIPGRQQVDQRQSAWRRGWWQQRQETSSSVISSKRRARAGRIRATAPLCFAARLSPAVRPGRPVRRGHASSIVSSCL